MRNTVIVLNEEFCSMSLAFQKAGYEVLLACESDTKSCNVYSRNINSNMVYESILDTDIYSLPEADVIAGKLEIHDWKTRLNQSDLKKQELLHIFHEIVVHKMPKYVLYEVNANAINTRNFRIFIDELSRYYRVNFQIYKINKITNLPVNERALYVVGIREDIYGEYKFVDEFGYSNLSFMDMFEYK